MLNRLVVRIKDGHIPFYWDHRDDLLKLDKVQAQNVGNCLENILKSIIKRIDSDPYILAEKLCKCQHKMLQLHKTFCTLEMKYFS